MDQYTVLYRDSAGLEITMKVQYKSDDNEEVKTATLATIKIGSWFYFIITDDEDSEIGCFGNGKITIHNSEDMRNNYDRNTFIKEEMEISRFYSAFCSILTAELLSEFLIDLVMPLDFFQTFRDISKKITF